MKRGCHFLVLIVGLLATSSFGLTAEVNKAGSGGAFTTIQAAIDSGATDIVITDSGRYEENLQIGDPVTGGPAVTLRSTRTGPQRPVITPAAYKAYSDVHRTDHAFAFGVFSNGSVLKNLIIEGAPELGVGALYVMADNVLIENCLFRPERSWFGTISFPNSLVFFAQQADVGGSGIPTPGGRNCDGSIMRDCEIVGVPPGEVLDSVDDFLLGYLMSNKVDGTAMVRMDHFTNGEVVDITFERCYFHHCRDAALFPSNRGNNPGQLNITVKSCRFDAFGKFAVRGRGANLTVSHTIFSRTNQGNHGDSENSAVAIQTQNAHVPNGTVTDCIFVDGGSAYGKRAYYGGVNNHNGGLLTVDHCTFVGCLSGAGVGTGGGTAQTQTVVSNCIFHQIGYNSQRSVDATGVTLDAHADLDNNALYAAWSFGLANFEANHIWAGVFNNYNTPADGAPSIVVNNCLVGEIASEDTRPWADVVAGGLTEKANVLGARLSCGYEGADKGVRGLETVIRGTPVFVNQDLWATTPFALAANSPGAGLGARIIQPLGMDSEGDGDVDINDFAVFQLCFNGASRPPACP